MNDLLFWYCVIVSAVRESGKGVTQGEAMEIVQYWLKYKDIDRNQIMIIEVPDIVKKE